MKKDRRPRKWEEGDRRAWDHVLRGSMSPLTDEETKVIVEITATTHVHIDKREGEPDEDEITDICLWAENARSMSGVLEGLLSGLYYVRWRDGDVRFSLTAAGEKLAMETAQKLGLPMPEKIDDLYTDPPPNQEDS